MMKIVKIMLVALILVGLAVSQFGCNSASDEAEALENQVVTVQRGDLTIDITAVGNLFFSHEEELAFEVSGTVGEVLVEVGDSVEEEQVLVKLDISEWEEQIDALERSLTTAERNLTSAERALATKLRSLLQAEINLTNAEIALRDAQFMWYRISPTELKIKEKQVEIAEMQLEEAENAVADAEQAIEDAQQTLADAQEELDEAKAISLVIMAPFAGLITGVNVSGGDVVQKGSVAVILADPSKFGATFMVGEMDILQVKLGGEAWVQVDAMPGMSLSAKVTHISPTATIQQGVVNYRVEVEIESLEAVRQEQQEARQEAMQEMMQGIAQGELPERLKQAIEEGQITQEQAEEMMERMQQGQLGQPGQGGQQAMPTMPLEDFQLREGLTVTVSILVEERNDVLLVPNGAITSRGGQAYVQVVSPDGTTEERPVTTGLSDWQYTEVTSGLSEGEKIIVPQGTTTTPTTLQPGGRMPFLPGGSPH